MNREAIRAALTGPSGSIRTPFRRDGGVDYNGLKRVIDANIAGGSRTALLTAGDSHFLAISDREIAEITKVTVKHTAGRAMVVAADRYYDTNRAIEFARYCRETGVDVLMVMPPDWGHSMTPGSLVEHYTAVAKHIPVMVVTNVFVPRGKAFGLETLKLALEKVPGIAAVKDDYCGEFGRRMALLVHDHWAVYSGGLKQNHLDIHPYGCDGYLSTLVTFKPAVVRDYWSAILSSNLPIARKIIREREMPWFDFIASLKGGFDAGIHGMLEVYGLAKRWRRKPYYSLTDAEMEQLRDCLKRVSLL
ncbi:MAG: dihydrodipicolinate synthase family protein [Verrucomicrobia bacterium]|nr:dihydrodipicolinate synthase family protein [Verrucomicrobiota bacterium]